MEEIIRTLTDTLDQVKNQCSFEFSNHKRSANQASMACNIIEEMHEELRKLEEECDSFDRWKDYTKVNIQK